MRLDAYLAQYYPEYSRSTWHKYITLGCVKVNGEVVTSPKLKLGEDDHVTYELAEASKTSVDIPVLYEDKNVLVIDKPAGILSHAKGRVTDEFTVADFAKKYTTFVKSTNRDGIVHRLDRDTSGVMIVAKNEATAEYIQKQFAKRKVTKTYIAVTKGHLKHKEANLELPIERNPKIPSQFRVGSSGKMGNTYYKVLKENKKYSLVGLKPSTGRTHQLRVHLAHQGAPILGDRIYGKVADRLYLHALSLELSIAHNQHKIFVSKLPDEFQHIMEQT